MKKIIEIDDELYEKLENIQKGYHIKTVSPVISLILTLGVKWFQKLNDMAPTMNIPTPIPYPVPYYPLTPQEPWRPYTPWYETWFCDGQGGTVSNTAIYEISGLNTTYRVGNWNVSSDVSGMSFDYVGK
jgi:hypothetical protein